MVIIDIKITADSQSYYLSSLSPLPVSTVARSFLRPEMCMSDGLATTIRSVLLAYPRGVPLNKFALVFRVS